MQKQKTGTGHHVDAPRGPFGKAPTVYRYNSGDNTHGVRQKPPKNPGQPGGTSRSDGPHKPGSGSEGR
jgi:hypothetical protein